jgi:hypothetical protein
MFRPIPLEEVIAGLPEDEQEAIAKRGAELVAEHDAWFRAKVQEALNDPRPAIPHEQVEADLAGGGLKRNHSTR